MTVGEVERSQEVILKLAEFIDEQQRILDSLRDSLEEYRDLLLQQIRESR